MKWFSVKNFIIYSIIDLNSPFYLKQYLLLLDLGINFLDLRQDFNTQCRIKVKVTEKVCKKIVYL
jgi:hypothetical protein